MTNADMDIAPRHDGTSADDDRPVWSRDGIGWPNREASRFVDAGGLRWHVQIMGEGPPALLLHGTGASTHSWAALAPLLATRFRVIAPDLPGHGFTASPGADHMSLPAMARHHAALLGVLDERPVLAVGHSAGAAILMQMVLDRSFAPDVLVSLNGALMPFGGFARHIFPPIARFLMLNPLVPRAFAGRAASRERVERLIAGTGSKIGPQSLDVYQKLFTKPVHVLGALSMMANWNLDPLRQGMPSITVPTVLVTADNDLSVRPSSATSAADLLPNAKLVFLRGLGHLAHEEDPERIAQVIFAAADERGIAAPLP
jgi:magnesium chelatase accessory protein